MNLFSKARSVHRLLSVAIVSSLFLIFLILSRNSAFPDVQSADGKRECTLDMVNSPDTAQDDQCLLELIRTRFLHPPSQLSLNLTHPEVENPSFGQSQRILELLNHQRSGFYIEAGALDGESYSNTLYMERRLNWTGLLVEANPTSFTKVMQKHRNAWSANAALSIVPYPTVVTFNKKWLPDLGSIVIDEAKKKPDFISVQSFPIYSILLALNRTTVDFFSLDVEGFELDILRTIPWSKVNIRTFAVEFSLIKEGKEALNQYMEKQGYSVGGEVLIEGSRMAYDVIYVRH